jgi:hypothetical protein
MDDVDAFLVQSGFHRVRLDEFAKHDQKHCFNAVYRRCS